MNNSKERGAFKTKLPKKLHALPVIKFNTYRRYRSEFISPKPLLKLCSIIVDDAPLPDCWKWTPEEVAEFVSDIGFPEFEKAFTNTSVTGKTLILIEADQLPNININNFDYLKKLTSAIRKLYNIDSDEFHRCINLPKRCPRTLYLWYKASRTGPVSYLMRPSSYFQRIKIIRDETTENRRYYELLNHWNRMNPYREWCPHVFIGNVRRINPMTGTNKRQNFNPDDHPYLLKNLCFYSVPCSLNKK